MGTDIHLSIEVNIPYHEYRGGMSKEWPWQQVRFPYVDKWWAAKLEEEPEDRAANRYAYKVGELYDGRNYGLFGVLSNVRNGRGFAGIEIGDPVEYSPAADRGLPEGECYGRDENWWADHTIGWLTLDEIFDGTVPWDQFTMKRGSFHAKALTECADWLENRQGYPRKDDGTFISYAGDISGRGVVHHSSYEAYVFAFADPNFDESKHHVVELRWMESVREYCSEFIEAMEWLRDYGRNGIPTEKWRIVIGYDS